MTGMDFDTSQIEALARDFADTQPRLQREMPRIMRKTGVNIKRDWSMDAAFSRHFRLGPTINFDQTVHFGAMHEVKVGPDRRRRAARLAGIAHFGGANGGGGTLGDPKKYVDAETPRMEQAIADLVDKVLGL